MDASDKRQQEPGRDDVDEAIDESFPASDPPAQGVVVGTGEPQHDDPEQAAEARDRAGEALDREKRRAAEEAERLGRDDLNRERQDDGNEGPSSA